MNDIDPARVNNLDDLVACLNRVRIMADTPTLRSLEQQTIHASNPLPGTRLKQVRLTRSTLSDVLLGRKFPGKAFMLTFVEACGIDIDNDRRWIEAWDRLAFQHLYPGASPDSEPEAEQLPRQPDDAATRSRQTVHNAEAPREQHARPTLPRAQRPGAFHFWEALESGEREALSSLASWQTFTAGTRLMEEGDRADQVFVILGGQVEIRVNENEVERVVAVRGLGDIVGERAALRVSLRSATVVALEMVWALVIQTKDFADFLSAHPRVLDVVQSVVYQRNTQGPDGYDSPPLISENCTVFLTDVAGFGAPARADIDRSVIREALFNMTQTVVADLPGARIEDRGDGFLTVVPPDTAATKVADRIFEEFPAALVQHNSLQRETARFQLRLAMTIGPVATDIAGVSGEATIVVARLVDAPDFKAALTESSAELGVIASPFAYEMLLKHTMHSAGKETFDQIQVEVKEFTTKAWMKLIEHKSGSA